MSEPVEITICMGSSCFSRGNKANLQVIQDYLKANDLDISIKLKGSRCEKKCLHGPVIRINGKVYNDVDPGSIIDLLNHEVLPIARSG